MTPSFPRTVIIGANQCAYRQHGLMPDAPPYQWPTAQPGAFLDYCADVSALIEEGDAITAAALDISPSGDCELIPAFLSVCGNIVSWWGWGGVPGRNYIVRILLQTERRRTIPFLVGLGIDRELASWPPPPPQNPGFGHPLIWSDGDPMFGPSITLPAITVVATGTTQLTAAPVNKLANICINAGAGGGVALVVPAVKWEGAQPKVINVSGGEVMFYLYSGDQFANLGVNAGTPLQDLQSMTLSVSESGAVLIFN